VLHHVGRIALTNFGIDRMRKVRDRKDLRDKTGNDQPIPLFAATGFDAWALVTRQAKELGRARGRMDGGIWVSLTANPSQGFIRTSSGN
jgi:hypothetical protein